MAFTIHSTNHIYDKYRFINIRSVYAHKDNLI